MTDASAAAPLTRNDIEAKIVALAWQDDTFRRKFVADPKGQFEERLGAKLPPSLKMTAHEENENSLHFVIPMKPKPAAELSDEELEKIAGGISPTIIIFTIAAGISAAASATTASYGVGVSAGW